MGLSRKKGDVKPEELENESKAPHVEATCGAPKIQKQKRAPLGVRATRPTQEKTRKNQNRASGPTVCQPPTRFHKS